MNFTQLENGSFFTMPLSQTPSRRFCKVSPTMAKALDTGEAMPVHPLTAGRLVVELEGVQEGERAAEGRRLRNSLRSVYPAK